MKDNNQILFGNWANTSFHLLLLKCPMPQVSIRPLRVAPLKGWCISGVCGVGVKKFLLRTQRACVMGCVVRTQPADGPANAGGSRFGALLLQFSFVDRRDECVRRRFIALLSEKQSLIICPNQLDATTFEYH